MSERVGIENFVKGFSRRYSQVPAILYGKFQNLAHQEGTVPTVPIPTPAASSTLSEPLALSTPASKTQRVALAPPLQVDQLGDRPRIKIALRRGNGTDWLPSGSTTSGSGDVTMNSQQQNVSHQPTLWSVTDNVTSFLNGIKASFRHKNVVVNGQQRSKTRVILIE